MKNRLSVLKETLIEKVKKSRILIVSVMVLWIVTIVFTVLGYRASLGKDFTGNEAYDDQIEITKETEIIQYITTVENTESISIKFAGYRRNNSGRISVLIENEAKRLTYADKTYNVAFVQDNAYKVVKLSKKPDSGEKLKITIASNSETGKAMGVYYSFEDYFEDDKCLINSKEIEGDLSIKLIVSNDAYKELNSKILVWSITGLTILLLLVCLCSKLEYVFASMIMVFGLVFMLIIVPGSAPDDLHHYETALSLSNVVLGQDKDTIDYSYVNYDSFADHNNNGFYFNRYLRDINKNMKLSNRKIHLNSDISEVYFGSYVPQSIGITIARLLRVNMLRIYYAGRLTNLLFYCICIFFAIRITPIHKVMLGLISSLPLFIQQASTLSYDSFINGLIFVLFAFLLKWKFQEDNISAKELVAVVVVNLALTPAKVIYGLFSFLFLFVPYQKFGGKKQKLVSMCLISGYTIYAVLYNVWIRVEHLFRGLFTVNAFDLLNDKFEKIEDVCSKGKNWKIRYFIDYPKETLFIYLKTIRYSIKKWFYEAVGKALSGLTLELPGFIFYTLIALIMASSFRKEDFIVSVPMKTAFAGICIVIAMLVLTTMLTGWLSPYDGMIQGVQGRYFCPLLPFFFSVFGNRKISIPKESDRYLILVDIFLMFETIVYILSYTFVN